MTKQLVRVLTVIACAWMMVLVASPAQAQNGNLRGKVVDEAGKPVADAEITLDFVGDYVRQYKVKTDSKGSGSRPACRRAAASGPSPRSRAI